ncbi:hypothetical protein RB195_017400 [Necator americanus]|uniref:Carboxylesterase type B domain-containing protein n=1 Tax=Necator americanus TaxID=51031 RepID=A0ABR1C847_NECAM
MSVTTFFIITLLPAINCFLVETSYGWLEGTSIQSSDNIACWMFKGIPFAQPPVGELRFKLPVPPKPWKGTRKATEYSAACLSNSSLSSYHPEYMSEDRLYTNIFVSEGCLLRNVSCPVIYYIHGGSLSYDSAVMFNDQYITDRYSSKDVVFVISAFRLGFFGVLAFENDYVVPRNLALYDVIAGLEFIHNEVAAFGGNPSQVTIMGHSQGGSTAMVLAVSSLVDPDKRLFQQLVAFSPALNYRDIKGRADLTWRLAHEVGCANSTKRSHPMPLLETERLVDCLRSVDAFDLLARQRSLEDNEGLLFDGLLFAPPFVKEGALFQDFLSNCTPRPMICSSTRYEFNYELNDEMYDIGAFLTVTHPVEVRRKYFEDKNSGKFNDSYLSQVVFTLNVIFGSIFAENGSNVYLLEYDQAPLPFHGADMPFFIGRHMRNFDKNEQIIDKFYGRSLLNFAYGKRLCKEWSPFHPTIRNYYSVEINRGNGLYSSNKLNYHSAVVDYWLHNITLFDSTVPKNVQLDIIGTVSNPSFLRTAMTSILFVCGVVVLSTALMALCSYLTPRDPPNHERVPLVTHKISEVQRKNICVIVPALSTRW